MNQLQFQSMIRALYSASVRGVKMAFLVIHTA
ncbi:hypothetical protein [Escherichia coli]